MNDSNYIKNYQNMLESDSILKNKTYNTKLDEDVSKSDVSKSDVSNNTRSQIKFSQKLYFSIKNEYPNITQFDIDKIFFDNNLPIGESKWSKIDKDLFVKAIKKKVGIIEKQKDMVEEMKEFQYIPKIEKEIDSNYIILSIDSGYRDKEFNPEPNNYRYLFTKSGPKHSQSHYINKILIDVSMIEISHIILPKIEEIDNSPYILLKIKELGSNMLGEDSFAKIMFNNKNDKFIEFSSNNREIYKKEYMPTIVLDQLNISFCLPNGELIKMPEIEHSITFKIWCKEQNI